MPWSQIAPWARISTASGWRKARSASPSAIGGMPRPAWIRIGTLASSASLKMRLHLGAVERKGLRARVQLDAAGSLGDAALALGDRGFGGIESTERDQASLAFAGPLQHAVVGQAVGGLALGVVQREHAGPARVGGIELGEQRLQVKRATVLVEPEMGVRVEDFRSGRSQTLAVREERSECVGVDGCAHRHSFCRSRGCGDARHADRSGQPTGRKR